MITYPINKLTSVTPQQLYETPVTQVSGSIDNLTIETTTSKVVCNLKTRYITDNNGIPQEVLKVFVGDNFVYGNPDWYGVIWDASQPADLTITRTGRMDWHRTLPIHSKMRRCILGSDESVRYIDPSNYLKDTDGNDIDYTTTKVGNVTYDVMVEIPEHYYETGTETINGTAYNYIKLYPYAKVGKRVPKHYIGAFEAMLDRTNNELYSCCKTNIEYTQDGEVDGADLTYSTDSDRFRGGNNSTSYTGAKTLLGRPATNIDISTFCTYAKNRGNGYALTHWESRNALLRLFVVEYATFDSQANFTEQLTQDGYHQGGLGFGFASTTDAWSSYNSYNPMMPCGVTLSLGSNTGVVKYNLGATYGTSDTYFYCPSYRGIENPFGHIWEITNGMYIYGSGSNHIFTATDGWYVRDFNYSSSSTPISGFKLKTTAPIAANWSTHFVWDSDGDFFPDQLSSSTDNTDSTQSPLRDYFYGTNSGAKRLVVGGSVRHGVRAGLFCLYVAYAVGNAHASHGSRLLYIKPKN